MQSSIFKANLSSLFKIHIPTFYYRNLIQKIAKEFDLYHLPKMSDLLPSFQINP